MNNIHPSLQDKEKPSRRQQRLDGCFLSTRIYNKTTRAYVLFKVDIAKSAN